MQRLCLPVSVLSSCRSQAGGHCRDLFSFPEKCHSRKVRVAARHSKLVVRLGTAKAFQPAQEMKDTAQTVFLIPYVMPACILCMVRGHLQVDVSISSLNYPALSLSLSFLLACRAFEAMGRILTTPAHGISLFALSLSLSLSLPLSVSPSLSRGQTDKTGSQAGRQTDRQTLRQLHTRVDIHQMSPQYTAGWSVMADA